MKIITYNPNTDEWSNFINSIDRKQRNKDKVINDFIMKIGTEISAQEYWNNRWEYKSWNGKVVCFIGEPQTLLEKIIQFVCNSTSYCHMNESFPEDFVESRTDWYSMRDYCDDMSSFIKDIGDELAKENK